MANFHNLGLDIHGGVQYGTTMSAERFKIEFAKASTRDSNLADQNFVRCGSTILPRKDFEDTHGEIKHKEINPQEKK